ncbi:MAG TPA: GDSL-type esterase/lipase family protein [Planctomycetota bacterium]|nr:GDSL-type esterase/lipase family protein [Planctomycetota bacterium]
MHSTPLRRKRAVTRLALALLATVVAVGACELTLRIFVEAWQPPLGNLSYAKGDGTPITFDEAREQHLLVEVAPDGAASPPRKRLTWAPGQTFFLCYTDADQLRRDWFDARGRVPVHINRFGLREREITQDKPAGQKRILCLGDSFTFAWGIPIETGWVRLLEGKLRASGKDVFTVNCGAAGTVCVDEYWWGLEHRFHVFGPDAVVVTICLNDLIPSSGLSVIAPPPSTGLRTLDLFVRALGRNQLDLDPTRDWVQELLDLPVEQALAAGLAGHDKPFEAMWSQGVPQACLGAMKRWCDERKVKFMVILWPFLQGLGDARHYPFQKLHDLVALYCKAAGIPFLDVLPSLAKTRAEDLWVTPADPHPNPLAQDLAIRLIEPFVATHCGL